MLIDQTGNAVNCAGDKSWECIDVKSKWKGKDDGKAILQEMIQCSVCTIVLPEIAIFFKEDYALLFCILGSKMVYEVVCPCVTRGQNPALELSWVEIHNPDGECKHKRSQKCPLHVIRLG